MDGVGSFHDKFVCGGWLRAPFEPLFATNLIDVTRFIPAAAARWTLRHLCFEEPLVDAPGNPFRLKSSWCPTVRFACNPN